MGQRQIKEIKRIILKIGTSSITYENGNINLRKMEVLSRIISDLNSSGREVVLVSSGAIGAGMDQMGLVEKPKDLKMKQAAAAVGQAILMQLYQKFFAEYNKNIAQILLTSDVFNNPIKKSNTYNTINTLFSMGIVPIVNENDCISTDEIDGDRFGDNDTLSAMVAVLVQADLLIILSDVEGLCDGNPCKVDNAKLITYIDSITDEIIALAENTDNHLGTGGMITKLNAAQIASKNGISTVLTNSKDLQNIYDILEGKDVGTYICGQKS
ncbi:MAG: glutamate 5-kinase [Eubacteriales bacterium]